MKTSIIDISRLLKEPLNNRKRYKSVSLLKLADSGKIALFGGWMREDVKILRCEVLGLLVVWGVLFGAGEDLVFRARD